MRLFFHSRGQNTEVRDAANNVSTASYDLLGNVTHLAGPLGGATNYTFDSMSRLTSESTVSGGTKSYEYNELSVRKKITNARGESKQVFYDAMGRITGYIGAEDTVSYTYDANGNVLADGDTVVIIKDLKVKGASSALKQGTKVKNIRLVDDGVHNIDCNIPGFGAMSLKSEYVKKA